MAGQSLHFPARLHIPDLDGFVPTAGNQPTAVRAECEAGDHVSMTGQGTNFAPGVRSQSLTVLSALAEASQRPFELNATA